MQSGEARQDDGNAEKQRHHPRLELDEAIHQPVRLSIMAILAQAKKVDFAFLRDYLELGDSNLSRHLSALESLGYIIIDKVFEGKRARTWISLSSQGRAAFENHVSVLRSIVEQPIETQE
ncbi:transcriptional regulator [Ktedonosporobacter rubrisoli]|uniref:Transcriptional regulator n=2 Tax=Ktedonosporobacter rubrisoli TaxID=2509675 RepID=A0A4P6K6R0_KTERU|nr:transcriptional regulator [Ktedonosporobacter rubrisoli]